MEKQSNIARTAGRAEQQELPKIELGTEQKLAVREVEHKIVRLKGMVQQAQQEFQELLQKIGTDLKISTAQYMFDDDVLTFVPKK